MILVWIYTKYCLFFKFFILKKTMIYERFVCFNLSKQIRRSTLSYKVFILFPLENYPFTGCKRKFDFAFETIEFDFDFEKSQKRDYPKRCKGDCVLNQIFYL